MDSTQHSPAQPQRLSALYQYHNAPEVAPAHGLEYDDTIYPSSDKYPVVHTSTPSYDTRYTGKHAYENSNKPPRIIFGMKVKTFLIVAFVMALVICGAAVGGAVGGKTAEAGEGMQKVVTPASTSTSSTRPSPSPTSATSTFAAPTPTYTPLSDCPASNNTLYASALESSDETFTKFCDLADPLTDSGEGTTTLTQAFVYSFSDCVEVCAALNVNGGNCTVAVYEPGRERPSNCWVGRTEREAGDLDEREGVAVAFLTQSR